MTTTLGVLGALLLTGLIVWVCRRIAMDHSQPVIEAKRALLKQAPVCARCGAPATIRVGNQSIDGGGFPTFRVHHWECQRCAQRELRIEHV